MLASEFSHHSVRDPSYLTWEDNMEKNWGPSQQLALITRHTRGDPRPQAQGLQLRFQPWGSRNKPFPLPYLNSQPPKSMSIIHSCFMPLYSGVTCYTVMETKAILNRKQCNLQFANEKTEIKKIIETQWFSKFTQLVNGKVTWVISV